jgi:FkbM family methyltransferase
MFGAPRGDAAIRLARMRDGSILKLDSRNNAEKWAYWTGDYDTRLIRSFLATCPERATVLDIGANVGLWSVPLGWRLRELGGCVHCFEPVPSNFEILCEQIRNNGLEATVRPERVALGEHSGVVTLAIMEQNPETLTGNAMIVNSDERGRTSTAPLVTLDEWADQRSVSSCHLVKMDIEGAELAVLRGGTEFIQKHRPLIYGEFNSYWMQVGGCSICDVAQILFPFDYRMYAQIERGGFSRINLPQPGLEEVLFLPIETPSHIRRTLGILD